MLVHCCLVLCLFRSCIVLCCDVVEFARCCDVVLSVCVSVCLYFGTLGTLGGFDVSVGRISPPVARMVNPVLQ